MYTFRELQVTPDLKETQDAEEIKDRGYTIISVPQQKEEGEV